MAAIRSKSLFTLALVVVLCVLATPSSAALLNPPAFPGPGFAFPDPFTGCTPGSNCILLASITQTTPGTDILNNVYYTATLAAAVYMDSTPIAGVRAGAGLDFFYQISNAAACSPAPCTGTGGAPDSIGRMLAGNFNEPGLLIDVGTWTGTPGGLFVATTPADPSPGTVDRQTADAIGFNFSAPGSNALRPGTTSQILFIATNYTHYSEGIVGLSNNGTANFAAFQPSVPSTVPEPASAALLGLGLLVVGGVRARRKRA